MNCGRYAVYKLVWGKHEKDRSSHGELDWVNPSRCLANFQTFQAGNIGMLMFIGMILVGKFTYFNYTPLIKAIRAIAYTDAVLYTVIWSLTWQGKLFIAGPF